MVLMNLLSFDLLKKTNPKHCACSKNGIYWSVDNVERTERGVEIVYCLLEAVKYESKLTYLCKLDMTQKYYILGGQELIK